VFAIAASTAGTISFDEAGRLQAYLILYGFGAILIGFVIFPLLVTSFTPLTYRQLWRIAREPMITAFATGKLIIVLPMLIQNTEKLLGEADRVSDEEKQELELLYATAYAFPHAGKLLSMLFIPFVAWFFGNEMKSIEYPGFLLSGLFSYFGGPLIAIPFLLDAMHLPHDMFQLFVVAGVAGERVGDAVGVMHLVVLVLITLAILRGSLDGVLVPALKFLATSALCTVLILFVAINVLARSSGSAESKSEVLAHIQLIESPVESVVISVPSPNPVSRSSGETVIERIRRRDVIRIGFNEDKLPFAFFNVRGELVGFDINLAHALARDLGVSLEFVRFDRATLAEQLRADHFDFVMSGLVGTLERSEAMQHSDSYMDVTLGLVVPDYRVREFKSLSSIRELAAPRIGFVDLSSGFISRLKAALPDAQFIEIRKNGEYFTNTELALDALLISAESGSAFTLLYPDHEVAIPEDLEVKLPLFYAITGRDDSETRSFLNHWIELRQKDGTFREYYEHWILGKTRQSSEPRWSVIRNVLHWVH
jgi:ABC-type amino acid transport substrate-binding protein